MRDGARRCTATSKRTGKPCRFNVFRREDGTYTTTCHYHSGRHQLRAPGDPQNGGTPPTSFTYSRIVPEEFRAIYDAAHRELGKLDHEVALARTNLYRFQQRHEEQQKGGVPTSVSGGGTSVSVRTYEQIVGDYLDRIGRLEERRARVLATLQQLDDPPPPPTPPAGSGGGLDENDPDVVDDARARLRRKLLPDGD
jgi:hypothetical protein